MITLIPAGRDQPESDSRAPLAGALLVFAIIPTGRPQGPPPRVSWQMQVFGQHEESTLTQLRDIASRAERVALMADGHVGYVMPIGGVAAYRDRVSVVGVGFDIACGNAAIRTNLLLRDIDGRLAQLADEINDVVSF